MRKLKADYQVGRSSCNSQLEAQSLLAQNKCLVIDGKLFDIKKWTLEKIFPSRLSSAALLWKLFEKNNDLSRFCRRFFRPHWSSYDMIPPVTSSLDSFTAQFEIFKCFPFSRARKKKKEKAFRCSSKWKMRRNVDRKTNYLAIRLMNASFQCLFIFTEIFFPRSVITVINLSATISPLHFLTNLRAHFTSLQ